MIVMFGMGLTLKFEDFKIVFTRPNDILVGCVAQFTIMPLIALLLGKIFGLEAGLLPVVSITAITLIVGSVVSHNSEKILSTDVIVFVVVVLHNIWGYGHIHLRKQEADN